MKFIDIVCAAFFARVKPVSTIANPACMNMTRKPVSRVQTMLIAILLWPTVSMTSTSVGLAASFTATSAAVPVTAPVGSGPRGVGAGAASVAWACRRAQLRDADHQDDADAEAHEHPPSQAHGRSLVAHSASSPRSAVRMRTAPSRG